MKDNVIREKSFDFALEVIDLYKQMIADNEYVLSKQLLRSGTSIGANVEEASAAQAKRILQMKWLYLQKKHVKLNIG